MARGYHRLLDLFGWIAGIVAVLIGAGVSLDVVLRYCGRPGIPWMLEASEYGLYVMTFFGAPWALRENAHVHIDLFLNRLSPAARYSALRLGDVIGLVISLVLTVYSARVAFASWSRGSMIYKELVFPEWWLLGLLPICMALLTVEFVRRLRSAP